MTTGSTTPQTGAAAFSVKGCHFIDFACWFMGALPRRVSTVMRGAAERVARGGSRASVVTLDFDDGSLAQIVYFSGGSPRLGKEYFEAHSAGRSAVLHDFRRLVTFDNRRRRRPRSGKRDKGHDQQFQYFFELVRGSVDHDEPTTLDTASAVLTALDAAGTGTSETR